MAFVRCYRSMTKLRRDTAVAQRWMSWNQAVTR